jgi:hypothetical protein
MPPYSNSRRWPSERIRSRFAEAEEFRLACRGRAGSGPARMTRGQAGSKKLRLPVLRLSATRMTRDTASIRLQRRAS